MKKLTDLDVSGKTILLRVDLNVPVTAGKISDTTRIDRLRPTISYLRGMGAKVLVLSHFGRPEGEQHPEMSLAFLMPTLEDRWGCQVSFAQSCIGETARGLAESIDYGEVGLLENVRFHKGEAANEPSFSAALAELGDIFVNDAFSASHRAHASTEGIAHHLPSVPGLLMEAELSALKAALDKPRRPSAAIVGGSKISTKLGVLHNLIPKVDVLVLGGGMANTFLAASGLNLGSSLCERGMDSQVQAIMNSAEKHDCDIVLPRDAVCVRAIRDNAAFEIFAVGAIPEGFMAIDIGPATIAAVKEKLKLCSTVLWNGPMGVFEVKPFDNGTNELAKFVEGRTRAEKMISVAGGGDTLSALENAKAGGGFTYLSLAGGAFLEWLEGRSLPGIEAL